MVTDNAQHAAKLRYLSTQAKDDEVRYVHHEVGYNYRLTNLQAALGVAQLELLPEYLRRKRHNFEAYQLRLNGVAGLTLAPPPDYADNNLWMYALQIDAARFGRDREQTMAMLGKAEIQSRPVWHLNHLQRPYLDCQSYRIERATDLHSRTLNIPCSVNLTDVAIDRVVMALKQ